MRTNPFSLRSFCRSRIKKTKVRKSGKMEVRRYVSQEKKTYLQPLLVLKPLVHNIKKILGRLHQVISVFLLTLPQRG